MNNEARKIQQQIEELQKKLDLIVEGDKAIKHMEDHTLLALYDALNRCSWQTLDTVDQLHLSFNMEFPAFVAQQGIRELRAGARRHKTENERKNTESLEDKANLDVAISALRQIARAHQNLTSFDNKIILKEAYDMINNMKTHARAALNVIEGTWNKGDSKAKDV